MELVPARRMLCLSELVILPDGAKDVQDPARGVAGLDPVFHAAGNEDHISGLDQARLPGDGQLELTGEDESYLYLKMTPRAGDSSFALARISIRTENHLPRQLWFQQRPGTEVRWDFTTVNTEAKLQVSDFREPPLPTGWKYRWMNPFLQLNTG